MDDIKKYDFVGPISVRILSMLGVYDLKGPFEYEKERKRVLKEIKKRTGYKIENNYSLFMLEAILKDINRVNKYIKKCIKHAKYIINEFLDTGVELVMLDPTEIYIELKFMAKDYLLDKMEELDKYHTMYKINR